MTSFVFCKMTTVRYVKGIVLTFTAMMSAWFLRQNVWIYYIKRKERKLMLLYFISSANVLYNLEILKKMSYMKEEERSESFGIL